MYMRTRRTRRWRWSCRRAWCCTARRTIWGGRRSTSYTYDAWGACTTATDTSGVSIATVNPFHYRSYYYDAETGWYYLQSWYYDPEVGRFLNADEAVFLGTNNRILSYNLFSYCKNGPVLCADPGFLPLEDGWLQCLLISFLWHWALGYYLLL